MNQQTSPPVISPAPVPVQPAPISASHGSPVRVRVFVDYWNFQLTMNDRDAAAQGIVDPRATQDHRFAVDWIRLGTWLAKKACQTVGFTDYSFDGVIIYASYNPNTQEGRGFHKWATTWLDRQPGVRVECFQRKPKAPPRCPSCHIEILNCPHCSQRIVATVEKGVDTLIATDMIRLAWENAYDLAVIASSDSDLVPAVEFRVLPRFHGRLS